MGHIPPGTGFNPGKVTIGGNNSFPLGREFLGKGFQTIPGKLPNLIIGIRNHYRGTRAVSPFNQLTQGNFHCGNWVIRGIGNVEVGQTRGH